MWFSVVCILIDNDAGHHSSQICCETIELFIHVDILKQNFHGNLNGFLVTFRYWQTRTHCCGHIVADTNVSPFARARIICCGHKFCVRDKKMVLILFRNILCPQQMFPSLRAQGNIMSNNVSATVCPRLPVPFSTIFTPYF